MLNVTLGHSGFSLLNVNYFNVNVRPAVIRKGKPGAIQGHKVTGLMELFRRPGCRRYRAALFYT